MITVWILIAQLGGTPVTIDNIESEAACRDLATQIFNSPYLTKKDIPACFKIAKALAR